MDFHSLTRRELQALCKNNKIPANMTNVAMADALKSLEIVQGIEDFFKPMESETVQSSIESPEKSEATSPIVPGTVARGTRLRNLVKEEPQTLPSKTTLRRSTRKAVAGDEGQKAVTIETPAAVTTRRRAVASSVRRKVETQFEEEEEIQKEKKTFPPTPAPSGFTSRRRVKEEDSTVKKVYSTRRSARLAEKNIEASNENLETTRKELFNREISERSDMNLKDETDDSDKILVINEVNVKTMSQENSESVENLDVALEEDKEKDKEKNSEIEDPRIAMKVNDDTANNTDMYGEESDESELVTALEHEDDGSHIVSVSEIENALDNGVKPNTYEDDGIKSIETDNIVDGILENKDHEISYDAKSPNETQKEMENAGEYMEFEVQPGIGVDESSHDIDSKKETETEKLAENTKESDIIPGIADHKIPCDAETPNKTQKEMENAGEYMKSEVLPSIGLYESSDDVDSSEENEAEKELENAEENVDSEPFLELVVDDVDSGEETDEEREDELSLTPRIGVDEISHDVDLEKKIETEKKEAENAEEDAKFELFPEFVVEDVNSGKKAEEKQKDERHIDSEDFSGFLSNMVNLETSADVLNKQDLVGEESDLGKDVESGLVTEENSLEKVLDDDGSEADFEFNDHSVSLEQIGQGEKPVSYESVQDAVSISADLESVASGDAETKQTDLFEIEYEQGKQDNSDGIEANAAIDVPLATPIAMADPTEEVQAYSNVKPAQNSSLNLAGSDLGLDLDRVIQSTSFTSTKTQIKRTPSKTPTTMKKMIHHNKENISSGSKLMIFTKEKVNSPSKTPTTKKTLTDISDDKENHDSGKMLIITKEKVKKAKGANTEQNLEELSLGQLTKMLKEKLKLNENGTTKAAAATSRQPLQALPENQTTDQVLG